MRDYAGLYLSLLEDLGFESCPDSHIYSDMDPGTAARVSLANSFYKKLCPDDATKVADDAALEKFLGINRSLLDVPFVFEARNEAESCFYDYFKHHLNTCLGHSWSIESFDLDYIRGHMNVGPGAAQKADASSLVTKLFNGKMTFTNPDLIPLYRAALSETGFWADAEMQRFQKFGFDRVPGSKLFFAKKNAEISRVCGTEANLNMLIQKAVGEFCEFRCEWYFGINLSTQPLYNRDLARKGSIDGSIGTIDLVSASDCISTSLIDASLDRSPLKTIIFKSRSEETVLPDGKSEKLRMIATMGNGFTFPLQTIIFASAVKAVYQLMGFPCDCPKTQFGVFGDDICVRKETYVFLSEMLNRLGFKVNGAKSFNSGNFRESCGGDFTYGTDIRGVYVRSLETPQFVYSTINRLARWSAQHGIKLLRTLRCLRAWVRDIRIPPSESDDAGLHVPFCLTTPKLTNSYWFKYRAYVKRRNVIKINEPDDQDPERAPFNPNGEAVGFLSGVYRRRDILLESGQTAWSHDWSVSVSLRDRVGARSRYQIVNREIPFWDYLPDTKMVGWSRDGDDRRTPLTRCTHKAWESLMVELLAE